MFSTLTLIASVMLGQAERPDSEAFFELKIRPVLAGTCFKCHGGDKTASGLRVDSRAALLKGGKRGPAVVPGNPDAGSRPIRPARRALRWGRPCAAAYRTGRKWLAASRCA